MIRESVLLMWMSIILLTVWSCCEPVNSAPAPLPKCKMSDCTTQIEPGDWELKWGESLWLGVLEESNKGYFRSVNDTYYILIWSWNKNTRLLLISESINGQDWTDWKVHLDKNMKGKVTTESYNCDVSFRKLISDKPTKVVD